MTQNSDTTVTTPTSGADAPAIDFWFDPSCPWAWMTSRWMVDVAEQRGYTVNWHILSLGVLNEGRDLPADYAEKMTKVWTAARATVGVGLEHDAQTVGKLYTAIGTRFHPGERVNDRDAVVEAFEELGLDTAIIDRAEAGEFDEEMRASTQRALDLVGDDVGVPVLAVDGVAFFGPVVSPAPRGEEALRLFDGVVAAASVDGFFELKRSRTRGPVFD